MPATRAQRQRVQQRRHTDLPDEIVRHIIDIAGPYCVLVKGGQACSLEIPRTAGRTAKAYLAPVSNNLIRVGVDHAGFGVCKTLPAAIAAARDGCTILVEDHVYRFDNVVTVPPIRLQIVGNTRGLAYGTRRTPRGEFEHSAHRESPWICGSDEPRVGGGEEDDGGVFWVEGAGSQLTLRNLAFVGVSDDWEEVEEDQPVQLGGCDSCIVATQGARVTIEDCWFSNFGRMGIQARHGARIEATAVTFNRHYFGAVSEDPQSSVVLRDVDFQGAYVYACLVEKSGSMDLRSCRIREAQKGGILVREAGSRARFDAATEFTSRRALGAAGATQPSALPAWVRRAIVTGNGSLTFPDKIHGAYDSADWDWASELPEDSEGAGDWDDRLDECRWVTVREDIWITGTESSERD